jgi:hypothetical protein
MTYTLNKKLAIGIIGVAIAIGVIITVSYSYFAYLGFKTNTESSNSGQLGNQTTTTQGKHFSVDLNESVGITAHP